MPVIVESDYGVFGVVASSSLFRCWWGGVVASALVRPKATCSNMLEQVFHKTWEILKNIIERQRIGLLTGSDWRYTL